MQSFARLTVALGAALLLTAATLGNARRADGARFSDVASRGARRLDVVEEPDCRLREEVSGREDQHAADSVQPIRQADDGAVRRRHRHRTSCTCRRATLQASPTRAGSSRSTTG